MADPTYKLRQVFYRIPTESNKTLLMDMYVIEMPEGHSRRYEIPFSTNFTPKNIVNWSKSNLGYDVWQLFQGWVITDVGAKIGNETGDGWGYYIPTIVNKFKQLAPTLNCPSKFKNETFTINEHKYRLQQQESGGVENSQIKLQRYNDNNNTWVDLFSTSFTSTSDSIGRHSTTYYAESPCAWVTDIDDMTTLIPMDNDHGYSMSALYISSNYIIRTPGNYPDWSGSLVTGIRSVGVSTSTNVALRQEFYTDLLLHTEPIDFLGNSPYEGIHISEEAGGTNEANPVQVPDTINDTASSTLATSQGGLVTVFTPDDTELAWLKSYLFATTENVGDLIPIMQGVIGKIGGAGMPNDYILNFYELPVSVPSSTMASKPFSMGFYHTDRAIHYTNATLLTADMGSITIERYYGNSLDYKASIEIFLPYIGYRALDAGDVMGKTLHLIYNIDLYTGNCVAQIYVDGSIHYQFNGNMAYQLPLGQSNYSNQMLSTIGSAVSMIGKLAAAAA